MLERARPIPEGYETLAAALSAPEPTSEPPCSALYHYTNVQALQSIVEQGVIWASHIAYLNDSSELAYSHEIFRSVVRNLLVSESSEHGREFLDRCDRSIDPFNGMREFFVVCFCEDGDLLSQWRSYALGGGGYALGLVSDFDKSCEAFVTEPQNPTRIQFTLAKVNYDGEYHRRTIEHIVEKVLALVKAKTAGATAADATNSIAEGVGFASDHLNDFFTRVKNPAFRGEQEWRLVVQLLAGGPDHTAFLRFRPSGSLLIPYLNLHLRTKAGVTLGRLPLESVVLGPTTPALAQGSVQRLLRRNGYPLTNFRRSSIPLRGTG